MADLFPTQGSAKPMSCCGQARSVPGATGAENGLAGESRAPLAVSGLQRGRGDSPPAKAKLN